MVNKWICSDLHLGHANIIKFTDDSGKLIRPGFRDEITNNFGSFPDIGYHDELYIARHNALVAPGDKVYILGDIGKPLKNIQRLNGKKRLILGNHDDIHDMTELSGIFDKITAWRVWSKEEFGYPVVFSHFPLHASENKPQYRRINVHGHIHEKTVKDSRGADDPWYINVCVEHTNHAPMSFDQLRKIVSGRIRLLKALGQIS
jgi:calcineurin-like phosphoesterase family protein